MDIILQFNEEFNDIVIKEYDYDKNDVIVPVDDAPEDDSDTDKEDEPESDAEDQGYPESLSWSDIDLLPSLNLPISKHEDDGYSQW